MRAMLASATVIALVTGEGGRAFFSTPTIMASPMRTPTYGQVVSTVESTPYFQPVPASAVQRSQPERPLAHYMLAAALCGAAATVATIERGQQRAVAELDLESAASATKIAMLFSSGKAKTGRAALKKKPATRKPAAKTNSGGGSFSFFSSGSVKSTAKPTGRAVKSVGRRAGQKKDAPKELPFAGQAAVTLLSAPLLLTKAFFSKENWLYQAIKLVVELPANNAGANGGNKRADNQIKGG